MRRRDVGRRLRMEKLEDRRLLKVFIAFQQEDDGSGDVMNTLSWAIESANTEPIDEPHTIAVTAGVIVVTGSLPEITAKNVTVEGDGGIMRTIVSDGAPVGLRYSGGGNAAGTFKLRNLEIAGFTSAGVQVGSLSVNDQVEIRNNWIHHNENNGILVQAMASGATGKIVIENNRVWANGSAGIGIDQPTGFLVTPTTRSSIKNNIIGLDNNGASAGNLHDGIYLGRHVNSFDISLNTIAYNEAGIALAATAGTGNAILTNNNFYSNVGRPVDLNDDGDTPNDPGDMDSGPNNLLNHPVVESVRQIGGGGDWETTVSTGFDEVGSYVFAVYKYVATGLYPIGNFTFINETAFGGGRWTSASGVVHSSFRWFAGR